ncbi:14553_t:CDS:2, partial [Entrophospora sp. SA101]
MSVEQLEKKINKLEADLDKYMVEPNEKESSQFFQFFGNQIALMNDVLFKYQKDAIKTFIGLPEIQEYLYNNVIFIPADFPGQLYICRAIVKKLKNENETSIPEKITHLFPFLGPLHLALNTKESVFLTFWPFFDQLYRSIFNKKHKLAAKPKPWRIDTLMYLAHAGWELVRRFVDINNELFSENNIQNTNPDFEDADHIISLPGIDNQLQKRIL